ncbi:NADPH-dependent FMN reductase [Brevibacterium album]|uniref:NADPH-dependent FMN reductase n=1 Tax=Brevibacterium album TaxID=417948 RepID=UPI00040DC835|nr:NAD(P)H-dependent oxidoreductase [Brevibacterium album]
MTRIGIIAGSNRPGALNPQVVDWVKAQLDAAGVENAVVRYEDFDLPILDEPIPGGAHQYQNAHTVAWGAALEPFDGYIVVTPEYNHSVPGPLKNAIDFVGPEFAHKPVAFVSYGADKGVRAVEAWRLAFTNFRAATVRGTASFSIFTDFAEGEFAPEEVSAQTFGPMLGDLLAWAEGFKTVRAALAA